MNGNSATEALETTRSGTSRFTPPKAGLGPFGIYYGWYNVAAALVCIMVGVGSTSYSFGLFIKPAAAELGLSRASTNLGLILFHVGSSIASPLIGNLLDRFPLRSILITAACLFVLGATGVAFSASPLLISVFIVGPLAFGTVGLGSLFGVVLVSRWFTDRRGRAISIMALGTSLGGMFIFPLIAFYMASFGWRGALVAVAATVGSIVLAISFLIRPRPDPETAALLGEHSVPSDQVVLTTREVLGNRDFWLIAFALALMLGADQAMLATVTPYMLDRGMSLAATASVMSAKTGSAIAGKLLIAWLADKIDLRILLGVTGIFGVILCLVLSSDPSYLAIISVSLLTGLAIGGTFPLGSAIMAQRFGAASVGKAIGLQVPLISVSIMGALFFVGAVYDLRGSYNLAFVVFSGVFAAAICMLPLIRGRPEA